MYNQDLYSRAVRFQKTAVDNTFLIFSTLQGHGEQLLKKSLEKTPWMTESGRKTCTYFSDSCIDGSNYVKNIIDQGFDEMEKLLAKGKKTGNAKQEPTKPAGGKAADAPVAKAAEEEAKSQLATKAGGKNSASASKAEPPVKSAQQSPAVNAKSAEPKASEPAGAKPATGGSTAAKKS